MPTRDEAIGAILGLDLTPRERRSVARQALEAYRADPTPEEQDWVWAYVLPLVEDKLHPQVRARLDEKLRTWGRR